MIVAGWAVTERIKPRLTMLPAALVTVHVYVPASVGTRAESVSAAVVAVALAERAVVEFLNHW